jgi:DNA-binding CsgD family transcriptional regulator
MPRLSAADVESALFFVHEAADVAGPDPFPVHIVERLRALLGCEWGSYCELDRKDRRELLLVESPVPEWQLPEATFWRLVGEHPLCRAQRRGRLDALKLSDFIGSRALHRLELYADWLRPSGCEFELEIGLPSAQEHTKTFLFDDSRRDFGERERTLLNLLAPHLIQLDHAAAMRRHAEVAWTLVQTGVVQLEQQGVLVVDAHGSVQLASDRARHLLAGYFSDWTGTRLPFALVEWLHGLKAARAAVATPTTFTVNRPTGTLFVESVHHHADGILIIHERAAGEPRETLTPREREVLALVGDGMRNSEIAETLWVSPGTVRKHLENIYDKLGVHTRTAAVAQVRRSD